MAGGAEPTDSIGANLWNILEGTNDEHTQGLFGWAPVSLDPSLYTLRCFRIQRYEKNIKQNPLCWISSYIKPVDLSYFLSDTSVDG